MNSSSASASKPAPLQVPWDRVDHFIGQFTHDLRNGLNAMELQLTLLGEINQDATLAEDIRTLRGTLANLSRDIQAVRVAAGPAVVNAFPYPVVELLDDLRARQEKRAARVICWQLPPAAQLARLMLEIDPELLIAALLHLLDNAQRFRDPPNARLTFAAEAQPAGLRLSLIEEKSGPPPPEFALDAWGEAPLLTTRRGGYGLGLFRARRAIEAQGGTLQAEWTTAPPQVLRSTIWLPAAKPVAKEKNPQPPTATLRV
ncbi:MAG: HAMP domain-containing histidine kinase [Verrucomicrobia bacterium]|nr:HAMP domain-containing histidine kinase [Verrucomicrobiota bacterium]